MKRTCGGPAGPALALAIVCGFLADAARATVPPGFTDALIADNVGAPTALAFTPDGRLLITNKGGALRVYQSDALLATPALTIPAASICTDSERGLLGVAVHPSFSAGTPYIYLYYTFDNGPGCVNRVSRFTLPASNLINPASELILVDNMPSPNGNHNAGDLQFGRDGHLYITIGDGGPSENSRLQHVLTGKVLRITADGGIPADNPFQGAGTARCNVTGQTTAGNKCRETYAWGFRNPFRIAHDPNNAGTRFFVNDVGAGAWEEIDFLQSGADFGWHCREGAHTAVTTGACSPTPPNMVDPIFEYAHGVQIPGTSSATNCNSITGGAFVPNGLWPGFDGLYMFSDFVCGDIFKLTFTGSAWAASDFATALADFGATHLLFGPFDNGSALYYTTQAAGGDVRRISRDNPAGNLAPVAVANGAPLYGDPPLLVTFDATGSSDPDAGFSLTYFWDFGDGTPVASTTSLTIQHTYSAPGAFTARLRARDQHYAFSAPVAVQVQPGATAHLDFFTLTPCRVADTRSAPGPYGAPALAAGALRDFTIHGVCGVPVTARAVAVNVTVTSPTTAGHLTIFPDGATEPNASTINFVGNQTKANNAVLRLSNGGALTVACHMASGSVEFILDVMGYFE